MKYSNSKRAKRNKYKRGFPDIIIADFETTTDPSNCYVWSFCYCSLNDKEPIIKTSIDDFMLMIRRLRNDTRIYFHNLKFDGTFIIDYLLRDNRFNCLLNKEHSGEKKSKMKNYDFCYFISDIGQWYSITIKINDIFVDIWDSVKILPFTLSKVTKDFDTEHKKTEMSYSDKKSLFDCSEKDIEYIKNDVLGLAEAIDKFNSLYSLDFLTIGSGALSEYKKIIKKYKMNEKIFVAHELATFSEEQKQRYNNALSIQLGLPLIDDLEKWLRKSYKGGFCYVNPKFQDREIHNKISVFDVNSLYPYVMSSQLYPIGEGTEFFNSPEIEFKGKTREQMLQIYYFVQIRINKVKLKKGFLPTFQIKDDLRFKYNEWITEIDVSDYVTLTLTQTDYLLLKKHYNIGFIEFVGGFYFESTYKKNIFKEYISHFIEIKKNSTGAQRAIAKLFLNSLYGKFSTKREKDYKILKMIDGTMHYENVKNNELGKSVNIAIGAAITSYARFYTITHAQLNYENFAYADTDSLHLVGCKEPTGLRIDDKKLGFWCEESKGKNYTAAKYLRQKTYVELGENSVDITACGMTPTAKALMSEQIKKIGLSAFSVGKVLKGTKLRPVLVKGGTVLVNSDFTIRK